MLGTIQCFLELLEFESSQEELGIRKLLEILIVLEVFTILVILRLVHDQYFTSIFNSNNILDTKYWKIIWTILNIENILRSLFIIVYILCSIGYDLKRFNFFKRVCKIIN